MFDGFHFDADHPYAYAESKRQLKLFRAELVQHPKLRSLGIDPGASGRAAITGKKEGRVWDYIRLKQARGRSHTDMPHLTIGVFDTLVAAITVPNSVKGRFKTRLKNAGPDAFLNLALEIEKNLRPITAGAGNAKPLLYATQRHYRSQRSMPVVDGRLDVDLRTLVGDKRAGVKYQPEWIEAVHQVLVGKRSNIQFGVEVQFSFTDPRVRDLHAVDLFVESWAAMWPLLQFVLPD